MIPRRHAAAIAGIAALGLAAPAGVAQAGPYRATGPDIAVIVREAPAAGDAPERAVEALGGQVGLRLDLIDAFRADLPAAALADLAATPGVASVTPDSQVTFTSARLAEAAGWSTYGRFWNRRAPGSLNNVAHIVGAKSLWLQGYTGEGVDVAVIDTGVAPVVGLDSGQVINGPDLSLDAAVEPTGQYDGLDAYGHGTVIAGIIAGRDPGLPDDPEDLPEAARDNFVGVAPGSRIVNVRVGAADGAADVSQVIAGIDWVVQHKTDGDLDIRVLNLAFGTDGTQDYLLDPLTYAVEVAWRHGLVVVVSAGNQGFGSPKLNNPAYDPFVIATGASDQHGTIGTGDDFIADFSSRGDASRRPDLMAPGSSIVSLRVPGSWLDEQYPLARIGDRFFRGSGTSQAAAVVSGTVALLLEAHPELTPDQVKALLATTGRKLTTRDGQTFEEGARAVYVDRAENKVDELENGKIPYAQDFAPATGFGSLDAARGSARIEDDGVVLQGEIMVNGEAWDGRSWSTAAAQGRSWSGGAWTGRSWSGGTWLGGTWSGRSWSGSSWSGRSWSGRSWTGRSWTGRSWTGRSWTSSLWLGRSWTGRSWSSAVWFGA